MCHSKIRCHAPFWAELFTYSRLISVCPYTTLCALAIHQNFRLLMFSIVKIISVFYEFKILIIKSEVFNVL
jgi:hypothetical protein